MENPSQPGPKERILAVAARLFFAQGYQATGVNQIIAEAGVAKASFYQHFPSKQALAVAFLERQHHAWFAWVRRFTDAASHPRGKIEALFDFLADWLEKTHYRGCAFINMCSEFCGQDNPLRPVSRRHKAELRDFVAALVAGLNLDVAPEARRAIADGILILFEGAIAEASTLAEDWPVEAARKSALELISRA
jgi:AcrR family transcriptional regulator